jgi:predicted RecB family endonuclease
VSTDENAMLVEANEKIAAAVEKAKEAVAELDAKVDAVKRQAVVGKPVPKQ